MGIKVNEQYGYFNSLDPSAEGAGDKRTYAAEQWAKQWELALTDGIKGGGDNLRVVPADAAYPLCTGILPGWGLIKGRHYRLYLTEEIGQDDPAYKLMQHMPAVTHPRVDRVVLRLNLQQTLAGRWIRPMVISGIEAEDPELPALVRTAEEWDISLAAVQVAPGQTEIGVLDIIDERFDLEVCGIIGSLMQVDLSPYVQQMQALVADGIAQVDDLIASIQLAWEVQTGNINADWAAFKAGLEADGYLPEYGQRLHAVEVGLVDAQQQTAAALLAVQRRNLMGVRI